MSQVLIAMVIANVLFTVKGFNDNAFFNKYKFQINKIQAGERIRMFSSAFLHADWMHLGFNMYALWTFGKIVNLDLGLFNFLIIYFGSLLTGSLYTLQIHKKDSFYSAVGASGAVTGVVFSSIMLFPEMRVGFFLIPALPGYVFGIGYLLYSIYGMKNSVGNIGHAAHLGGAIGGYVLTLFLSPLVFTSHTIIVGIMGCIIAGLLFFGDKIKM